MMKTHKPNPWPKKHKTTKCCGASYLLTTSSECECRCDRCHLFLIDVCFVFVCLTSTLFFAFAFFMSAGLVFLRWFGGFAIRLIEMMTSRAG